MGTIRTEIDKIQPAAWSRATVADGNWLQANTLTKLKERDDKIADLVDTELTSVKTSVATNASNIRQNSTAIESNKTEITNLKTRVTTAEGDIDALEDCTESLAKADEQIWDKIDLMDAASDVVDIYGNRAAFDAAKAEIETWITDRDIVKVLSGENNQQEYWRFLSAGGSAGGEENTWDLIGTMAPYYSTHEIDEKFDNLSVGGVKDILYTCTDDPKLPTASEKTVNDIYINLKQDKLDVEEVEVQKWQVEYEQLDPDTPPENYQWKHYDDLTFYTKTGVDNAINALNIGQYIYWKTVVDQQGNPHYAEFPTPLSGLTFRQETNESGNKANVFGVTLTDKNENKYPSDASAGYLFEVGKFSDDIFGTSPSRNKCETTTVYAVQNALPKISNLTGNMKDFSTNDLHKFSSSAAYDNYNGANANSEYNSYVESNNVNYTSYYTLDTEIIQNTSTTVSCRHTLNFNIWYAYHSDIKDGGMGAAAVDTNNNKLVALAFDSYKKDEGASKKYTGKPTALQPFAAGRWESGSGEWSTKIYSAIAPVYFYKGTDAIHGMCTAEIVPGAGYSTPGYGRIPSDGIPTILRDPCLIINLDINFASQKELNIAGQVSFMSESKKF